MALRVGLVGLPNVGKSTLFNALSRAGAEAANFPFCTIEPNVGVVPVPDTRLDRLAGLASSAKVVPTAIEFVDIAGLVEGASKGEGLGNQFLAHIREVDAICHVVRCFEDDDVIHVSGRVDPAHDIAVVDTELVLKDLDTVDKRLERARRTARSGDKSAQDEVASLAALSSHLDSGARAASFGGELDPVVALRGLELGELRLDLRGDEHDLGALGRRDPAHRLDVGVARRELVLGDVRGVEDGLGRQE